MKKKTKQIKVELFEKYYNKALRFLAFRPRSEKEIKEFLIRKLRHSGLSRIDKSEDSGGVARAPSQNDNGIWLIIQILAKLKEQKFLDDVAFTKWWIEQRTVFRSKGKRLIELELIQKGVSKEIIEQVVQSSKFKVQNEIDRAKELVQQKISKHSGLSKKELYQKLGGFLARRGYDFDTIKHAIDEVTKERV